MATLQQHILEKKAALAETVGNSLSDLALKCAPVWSDADALDAVLKANIESIPNCANLYAWDVNGQQLSSLVGLDKVDVSWRGNDLSTRPYLKNNLPLKGVMLSSVYESMLHGNQCVTALQAVRHEHELLGFIAADFPMSALLADARLTAPANNYQQYKGDPAVRGTLFMQQRIHSLMDEHIDGALESIYRLLVEHGVFHTKIHFSSGRCSFWLFDDPYNYRIHVADEIINPDLPFYYPMHAYPAQATVTPPQIKAALQGLRELRFADETIYLRSASINIINGMLGLTFSCDGSHYMPVAEFLEKNITYWLGELSVQGANGESTCRVKPEDEQTCP